MDSCNERKDYWSTGGVPHEVSGMLDGWCSENVVAGIEHYISDVAVVDLTIEKNDIRISLGGIDFDEVENKLNVSIRERIFEPEEYMEDASLKFNGHRLLFGDEEKSVYNEYFAALRDLFAEWSKEAGSRIKP